MSEFKPSYVNKIESTKWEVEMCLYSGVPTLEISERLAPSEANGGERKLKTVQIAFQNSEEEQAFRDALDTVLRSL